MGRPAYGGHPTCESRTAIDVRSWHREGLLHAGQYFSCSWTRGGEPSGSINVRTETDAVVLIFCSRGSGNDEGRSVEQRVPIVWSSCHLGGRRPWFQCTASARGRYCGRRVAKLYLGNSSIFACRHCYGLAYESQQQSPLDRSVRQAQKIRQRLGGSMNLLRDPFPEKPPGMHSRTYGRIRQRAEVAEERSNDLFLRWLYRRPSVARAMLR